MKKIIAITKKWIFVTSLFSDFHVEINSKVFEHNNDWRIKEDSPYNYNVYSFDKFKTFCLRHGAKELVSEDFIIDIDLAVPGKKLMGTYTVKQITGNRLQFSGPLFMPWKMIAIRLM